MKLLIAYYAAAVAEVLLLFVPAASSFAPQPPRVVLGGTSRRTVPRMSANTAAAAGQRRPTMPSHSPATSLPNQIYKWRNYDIRYQVTGPTDADHTLLLIHGLFVNSDHWRKTLTGLHTLQNNTDFDGSGSGSGDNDKKMMKNKKIRIYAIDLLGSGWSSKPSRHEPNAQLLSGENGRFMDCTSICYRELHPAATATNIAGNQRPTKIRTQATLRNTPLGTSSGGHRLASTLALRHPLQSPYNFFTWAEQITDFIHDVIHADVNNNNNNKVTIIANSIGTMSSLQSILDEPNLFNGCMIINPNFRELHMAEVPFSSITMPLVRQVQSLLRNNGHGLFASLANPKTVKEILKEPYAVVDAVDDELVQVLLDPLLTDGAADVVFDTLSYSAGPLPEQQLSSNNFPRESCPTWVVYGKDDPWTPAKRVENLKIVGRVNDEYGMSTVEKIVGLDGVGHCPHDESPEVVNRLILEFLDRLS
jgi:pimeloyl-ACP methyl ester carboxylesterase